MQVDGDTSTNDTVIALASGLSGSPRISSLQSDEARQLQACLDAVRCNWDSTCVHMFQNYLEWEIQFSIL